MKAIITEFKDSSGKLHYKDAEGNFYAPVNGGVGSIFSSIFQPKPGGTFVGNLIRTGVSTVATVQRPPQQPIQQPQPQYSQQPQNPYLPQAAKKDYLPWIIGGGLGVAALVIYLK